MENGCANEKIRLISKSAHHNCPCLYGISARCHRQPTPNKQIYVVFRFDDYSATSSTDIELRIIDAFRKHRASVTFSVIPFVCAGNEHDPSPQEAVTLTTMKGDILRAAFNDGTLDIALHGYSHQTIDAEKETEFKGLAITSQLERLGKGKNLLESMIGAAVTIFVPPWNRYGSNTLRALEQLGLTTISAKRAGDTTQESKLNFLPAFIGLSQLREAVKAARISSDTQPNIVVLFHEYDFREIN